jgi:hypothetical protein
MYLYMKKVAFSPKTCFRTLSIILKILSSLGGVAMIINRSIISYITI